ncbi:sensor histidine kinase [Gracilibacillus dipsosauri]|uniref:sensor histidine kinase n=1 Tax=Gracilibacillus dipsosauri TaxID=178340 RepID=UPI00240990E1
MIKIRTKLLMYFFTVITLVVILLLVREQSTQKIIELHEQSSEHYLLLNEITGVTDQTFQSLQIYVHEPVSENLAFYQREKQQLLDLQQQYKELTEESIVQKNFLHMLTSFLEITDKTVEGVHDDNIEQYSYYLSEADNTANYIHENTLEIINQDLTEYQNLISLEDERIHHTKNMGTAIVIAIIILSVLFALWFSDGITRTISRLTKAAKEISAGNYSGQDVTVSRKDELWLLTKMFNEMKHNILQSVKEMKEKARLAQLLKEMELKSLQNQINPHFLFNTLNTISKTSYIEGAERTSELISSVSALLRYNIGNLDRETVLKDEVEIVKEYFFIQQTRFGDRVTFHTQIEEQCLHTPIPCLTLQPIVENAFIHGIEEMADSAVIALNIYQKEQKVFIEITDNGKGMDQATINQIIHPVEEKEAQSKKSGHSTGIGMRNVIDRLELFDKESALWIDSAIGKGTKVTIQLPSGKEWRKDSC